MWGVRQRGHSVLMLLLLPVMTGSVSNKGNKHKPWIEAEYQGIVMENDRTVLLNPPLFAIDKDAPLHYAGEICGFKIHGQNVPFEAVVLDKLTGEGIIRAKEAVNCEAQREHTFSMQAHDCGENAQRANIKKSHKAVVRVRVNDVNEFVPVFTERLYRAAATEGELHQRLLRVQAVDGDCSPQYSQICFYEILTPGVPFAIDNDGNIRNTEKLDVRRETLYTFTVTAYDCGKKRAAEDAQVEIHVKPACRPAWHGLTRHMDYVPGSGPRALFPNIRLEACEQPLWNIEALVELETGHVAKGCDRDNYSERNLRKLCGAAPGELELLPAPSPLSDWTRELQTVPSAGPSPVYSFNGSSAASPPPGLLGPHLADGFTLSFWLLRAYDRPPGLETLICSTVLTDTGYTHYSVRIRSCRLYLVYWPQVENVQPMMFFWRPDQLCDRRWHHYTLNVQFPRVTLYVDAASYEPSLAHDPGLLHPPRPEARLVVAACWQDDGSTESSNQSRATPGAPWKLGNYLQGLVAGLTVRPGPLESRQVLECLYACREGLDFSDFDSLGKGMKVHISPSQSLLSLEGEDPESFSQALGHVTYHNSLRYATPGPRPLRLTTSIKCLSEGPCPPIPTVEGSVTVLPPDSPAIVLAGTPHLARPVAEFEGPSGVGVFPQLHITSSVRHRLEGSDHLGENPSAVQETLVSDEIIHSLDSCEIVVLGEALSPRREALLLDHVAIQQKGLQLENTTAAVSISGVETIAVYESLIRGIRYRIAPGAALYERKFRLHCSEMNRHYVSNEFTVEVNVVHSVKAAIHPNHIHVSEEFRQHASHAAGELTGHGLTNTHRASVVPGAATIIIVVCVGFLVLMVFLGIVRIQTLQLQRPQDRRRGREQEAFWDDSALTIVINPMESYKGSQTEDGGGETVGADPVTPGPGGRGR